VTARELEKARTELRRRREAIVETTLRAGAEHDGLIDAEHGQELEEVAQAEQGLVDLERLGATERQELTRIDAALERLEQGGYGTCASCGAAIEPRRLAALPWALRCTACEEARELAARR
jgi:DnaK suppressor protein